MGDVIIFKPKHELDHEKNLADFIQFGRQIAPLNDQYDYDSHYWEKVGNFTVFGANSRQQNPDELLDESILPFAKAYIVHGGGTKSGIDIKFKAIRALHTSCIEQYGLVDVVKLCAKDFNKAAEACKQALSEGAAYQGGRGLAHLQEFLVKKKMMKPFKWKNPINKPADRAVGDEADRRRQEKMPDGNALDVLASISSSRTEELSPRDIFTASTMTLLLSAPGRGSEPLYLRHDCIHKETMLARKALDLGLSREDIEPLLIAQKESVAKNDTADNSVFDEDGSFVLESSETECVDNADSLDWDAQITLKGVRWYSGKSFGHAHKWMPTVMYEAVDKAVERLSALSEEARNFARMLEESPNFPRHRLCPDVPEEQLLTMNEAALALGLDISLYGDLSDSSNRKKLQTGRNQLLKRKGIERRDFEVSLADLNKIVRNDLPENFPHIPFDTGEGKVKVKWSESLYACFANAFNIQRSTIHTELQIPTINTLNEDLAPSKKKGRNGKIPEGNKSIFQRWGYGDLVITSHQLRHMLDTMAAVNGMDGEMRAKWAMRSDPAHNRYYDHTTPEEYGADFIEDRENEIEARELVTLQEAKNTQIQVQLATPRTVQELNTKASLTAHTTEFGMCITSYMSEPCTKYRDCINCNEHVCEKGDDEKCDRIRQKLKKENKLLMKDKKAVDEGVQGALQWYERRKLTTERCEQLIKMFEDPSIEVGSLIKLANVEDVSLLDRAMDANGKKRLPKIENYQRLNGIENMSVNEMLGINGSVTDEDEDIFDDLDALDEIEWLED